MPIQDKYSTPVLWMDNNNNCTEYQSFVLEGTDYTGYYYNSFYIPERYGKPTLLFNNSCKEYLQKYYTKDSANSLCVDNIQEGSKIFLGPGINVPVEDLRKHYTIKRKVEDADYIVTNFSISPDYYYRHSYAFIWKKEKLIMFTDTAELNSMFEGKQPAVPTLSQKALDIINKELNTSLSFPDDVYTARKVFHLIEGNQKTIQFISTLLTTQNKTPWIALKNCTLGCNIPLTLDNIKVFCSACAPGSSKTAAIKAIAAISQTNWREYLGCLSRIWNEIEYRGPLNELCVSNLPVACKNFYSEMDKVRYGSKVYLSEKDYNMYQAYLQDTGGFKNVTFITRQKLNSIPRNGYPEDDFYRHYSICVKIRPRTYQEYKEAYKSEG